MDMYGSESQGNIEYHWYWRDGTFYIERINERLGEKISSKMLQLRDMAEYGYARFKDVIVDILTVNKVDFIYGMGILSSYGILSRIYKLYNKSLIILDEAELINIIQDGRLVVCRYKNEEEAQKAQLKYIVSIGRPKRNNDYVDINVNLVSNIEKEEILKWYNENKKEIFKLVVAKYNSSTVSSIPIKYYEIGAITLLNNNSIRFTLQVRTELYRNKRDDSNINKCT